MAAGGRGGRGAVPGDQPPRLPPVPCSRGHLAVRDGHGDRRGLVHPQERAADVQRRELTTATSSRRSRRSASSAWSSTPRQLAIIGARRRQPARPAPAVQVHPARQGDAGDLGQRRHWPAPSVSRPTRIVSAAWLLSGLLAGLAGVALAIDLGSFDSEHRRQLPAAHRRGRGVRQRRRALRGGARRARHRPRRARSRPSTTRSSRTWSPSRSWSSSCCCGPTGLRAGRVQMRAEVTV